MHMHLPRSPLTCSRKTFEQRWSVTHSMKSLTSVQVHCWGGAAEGRGTSTSRVSMGGAAGTWTLVLLVSCTVDTGGEGREDGGGGEALGRGRLL